MFPLIFLLLLVPSAIAQTLYFYPPDDAKWISGRSYISNGSQAVALELETNKCGWYKASIPTSSPLRNFVQFWLGKSGTDRIGSNGRWAVDFEPEDDFNSMGGIFRLGEKFEQLGSNNIYFVADELDKANPNAGWYSSDPGTDDPSRCRFELAALIYDTDPSVHPDFSCGTYYYGIDQGNGPNTYATCDEGPQAFSGAKGNLKPQCMGVIKGLAKSTLNPDTRKIECGNCTKNGCWTDADWFSKAFKSTPGVNVQRCYDMPFNQVMSGTAAGNFEFDSDKMLNASGRLVGGFFPEILNSAPSDPTCPSCNTKRTADRSAPLIADITREKFDAYESKEGDFKDGDTPTKSAFGVATGSTSETSIYDWSKRDTAAWYLYGNTAIKNIYGSYSTEFSAASKANEHFCFESHSDFYYDPSQVFYFSGDDDIWVYINNKLVIDLGGNHMPAPSHISLSTLGLIEGQIYPIDIFFCDRRTTQSNVRISTNMYIAQKSNFYIDQKNTQTTMCASITGSDCASVMAGNLGSEMCGSQLVDNGYTVDFYMVNRVSKDTVLLGIKNEDDCQGDANSFTCFNNGIRVENGVYRCGGKDKCKGDATASARVGIDGNFNVYARLMNKGKQVAGSKPILIDNIRSETSTPTISYSLVRNIKARANGKTILLENLPAGAKVEVYNLQGKLIYTSGKSLNRENRGSDNLKIGVQTKGIYIIKVSLGSKTLLTFNRSIYE